MQKIFFDTFRCYKPRRKKILKMIFEIDQILNISTKLEHFDKAQNKIFITQTRQARCVKVGSYWNSGKKNQVCFTGMTDA